MFINKARNKCNDIYNFENDDRFLEQTVEYASKKVNVAFLVLRNKLSPVLIFLYSNN